MIPDKSFRFNLCGTSNYFDDHLVRFRHLQRQKALPTDRHLLAVCPICQRPWYKAEQQDYPRLTPEQLAFLGATFSVDTQALYLLPRMLCTICSTLHLGGVFSAEAYAHQMGYRFRWESVSPRRIQLLAMVCRREQLILDALVLATPEAFAEPIGEARALLTWLESCSLPDTPQVLSDEHCQHLARCCPPGSAVDGRICQWRGYGWQASCAPLGGDALVALAVAIPTATLPPFSSLHLGWRVLARAMRAVL